MAIGPNSNPVVATVFVGYAHESPGFRGQVRSLCQWLRAQGVTVVCDFDHETMPPDLGWPAWMQQGIEDAAVVLVVASPKYKARFEKRAPPGTGMGATWEGAIITQDFYDAATRNKKFFPVIPDDGVQQDVPRALSPWDNNHRFPSGQARILELIRLARSGAVPPSTLTGRQPVDRSQVQTRDDATPTSKALAKLLSNAESWDALHAANLVAKIEEQVKDIRKDPTFNLTDAQSLYALCANPGTDPKRLLHRMAAVVIGPQARAQSSLQLIGDKARAAVIAVCKVLAERCLTEAAARVSRPKALPHEVQVPARSEAIATLMAAIWIHDDQGVQLEIGLTVQDHKPVALGALNVTNTPLEIGYPPADSGADLVKSQIYKRLYGQAAVVPTRHWKEQANEDYIDQHIPAVRSQMRQTLGDGLRYDLVATLDSSHCGPDHLLFDPKTRADIKDQFGIWTVIYGASDVSLAATRELAETLETAFAGIFAHL